MVPGRTESQCLYKWNLMYSRQKFTKQAWTQHEDQILYDLAIKCPENKQWQRIANEFNTIMGASSNRMGKQC